MAMAIHETINRVARSIFFHGMHFFTDNNLFAKSQYASIVLDASKHLP